MIKNFEQFQNLDNEIGHGFHKAITHLKYLMYESNFRHTTEMLFMFMSSSDLLKNAIFSCAKDDNFYSINVLYRSINEHFLRYKYFWMNNSFYKDDSYAFLFRTSLDFSEQLAFQNAVDSARKLKHQQTKTEEEIWAKLLRSNKNYEKFTKGEISEFAKSLSIKNILRYLERELKRIGREGDTFSQQVIIDYAQLSSFVHGGISAHKQSAFFGASEHKSQGYMEICGASLKIATSIKIFSYYWFSQFNEDFVDIYNNTQALFKKISDERTKQ